MFIARSMTKLCAVRRGGVLLDEYLSIELRPSERRWIDGAKPSYKHFTPYEVTSN